MSKEKYDLVCFLNKFVTPQIDGLEKIISAKVESDNFELRSLYSTSLNYYDKKYWIVEVHTNGLDECNSFKILNLLEKYIPFYGEICDNVTVRTISPIY